MLAKTSLLRRGCPSFRLRCVIGEEIKVVVPAPVSTWQWTCDGLRHVRNKTCHELGPVHIYSPFLIDFLSWLTPRLPRSHLSAQISQDSVFQCGQETMLADP